MQFLVPRIGHCTGSFYNKSLCSSSSVVSAILRLMWRVCGTIQLLEILLMSVLWDGQYQSYLALGEPLWLHDRLFRKAIGNNQLFFFLRMLLIYSYSFLFVQDIFGKSSYSKLCFHFSIIDVKTGKYYQNIFLTLNL